MMLYLDIESRSKVDLKKHGLERYARDPSTAVICMAYRFDEGPMKFWWATCPFPLAIIHYFRNGGLVMAHNAAFEQRMFEYVICNDYNFDPPQPEQWLCSATMCLANGFAAGLDLAAAAIGMNVRKNPQGTRLIREYCAPKFLKTFKPGDADLMREYCMTDVEIMCQLVKHLRKLTDAEWSEYHLNQCVNARGLPIDIAFCEAALKYADEVSADANTKIAGITNEQVTKHTQYARCLKWIFPKLTNQQRQSLDVFKKGEKKLSLDKEHRSDLLEFEGLDPEVREFIELINDAGSSALKKYSAALDTHVDGRVHDTFLWNGAQTGRFAGKKLQPHNMRRDAYSEEEATGLISTIITGGTVDAPAMTMARLLRSMIKSDDGLYFIDWSSIEGRFAPWLANSPEADKKLDLYRNGNDVYVVTAAEMFNLDTGLINEALADGAEDHKYREVAKSYRQSGKIAELSLQFGGGQGALIGMGRNYGRVFTQDEAQNIVKRWRGVNSWARNIWDTFDHAIDSAVRNRGKTFNAERVKFKADAEFLWMMLPSGRLLAYPRPRIEPYLTPWGDERIGVTFQHAKGYRQHARGALLFQNATQGAAACLLRRALVEADKAGLSVIGSIHDEILCEGSPKDGKMLDSIMLEVPTWAKGLPLATGGVKTALRFGK